MPKADYVKFRSEWIKEAVSVDPELLLRINNVRAQLRQCGWIGAHPDGTGFGNLSLRINKGERFLITGSATGHLQELGAGHLALVEKADIDQHFVVCRGMTVASSESLTHAACYRSDPEIRAVIHIHSRKRWKALRNVLPATPEDAAFGTPAMAFSIAETISESGKKQGIIVMGGHPDGLVAYGGSLESVFSLLQDPFGD